MSTPLVIDSLTGTDGRVVGFQVRGMVVPRATLAALETEGLAALVAAAPNSPEPLNAIAGKALLLAGLIKNVNTEEDWVRVAMAVLTQARAFLTARRSSIVTAGRGSTSNEAAEAQIAGMFAYFEFDWDALLAGAS
jgi:hypothetical protein